MFPESGLLNINKPKGITSFAVVHRVKKVIGVKKVGHCGTLDPMAQGVLLVVFGKATKLQDKLMRCEKTYLAKILFGTTTDTDDITGTIIEQKPFEPFGVSEVNMALSTFVGELAQIPPMFSAIKVQGKKLYQLARAGISIERKERLVTVNSIETIECDGKSVLCTIKCSSGTYVRSIARDLGQKLGCGATLEFLRRESSGVFSYADSIDMQEINKDNIENLMQKVISIETLMSLTNA
ncbi:MAG: tRNA pseudouridine(55) synthase TruB [Endomicrobiales bacterium]|nr:tRNA pseudouridine(55) synthase TruB [Endomicrobiales bacterium]